MPAINVWGRCITRCGGMRKQWWLRRTIRSIPLLQEVIKYAVKQYLYLIGKTAYLKIFYLYHRDDVLHLLLVVSQRFVSLVASTLAGSAG
jgi:hypothetical protein